MSIMPLQLPEVTVVGTLTADVELRFIASGKAVANFTIAANSRKKNQQTGDWEDGDATFLRCNIWGEYAEHCAESLVRGTKVIARGVLKQRSFETKEGEKRTVFELEVEEVGPTLRWATARVTKASKGGNGGGKPAAAASDSWGSNDEPGWG